MYETFEKLLKLHKISAYKVGKETGIASSTFTDWKNGRSTPKNEKLQKIADYFGITIEELNGNKEKNSKPISGVDEINKERLEILQVNDEVRILFDATKDLSPKDIRFVLEMVERMKGERK